MKTTLITAFIIILSLNSCSKAEEQVTMYYNTGSVEVGSFQIGDTYNGNIQSRNQSILSSEISGILVEKYVTSGTMVKKGDILGRIETQEINSDIASGISLRNNIEKLQELTGESYDAQKESLESQKKQILSQYDGVIKSIENTNSLQDTNIDILRSQILTQENKIQLIENNRINTENTLNVSEKNLYSGIDNLISNSLILDTQIIDMVDSLFGYTLENRDKNNDFEDYFGAKDIMLKENNEKAFGEIILEFQKIKSLYNTQINGKEYSQDEIISYANKSLEFQKSLKTFLEDFYDVIDATIINTYFSQNQIDSYKEQVLGFGTEIDALIISTDGGSTLGYKGLQQNLENFYVQKTQTLTSLEDSLNIEKNSLESLKLQIVQIETQNIGQNDQLGTQGSIIQEQINEIDQQAKTLEKQKLSKISELELQKTQTLGSTQKGYIYASNGIITAPFDGIILSDNFDIGSLIMPGSTIFEIGDIQSLFVEVSVAPEFAAEKSIGDSVSIVIGTHSIAGKIENIYNFLDTQGVQKIEISGELNTSLLGEQVLVSFQNTIEDGIVIPITAITEKFLYPGVYVIENNKAAFQNITIINRNNYMALVEGINPGDIIITEGLVHIYDGIILK